MAFAESAGVQRVLEPGVHFLRLIARAQAKIVHRIVDGDRIDHLARVHPVIRVPQSFELLKSLHQLRAVHFRQQGAAGLPVPVFARQRSAMGQDDVGGLVDKFAIFADALRGHQVEGDPQVHAALAEVSVHGRLIPIAFEQPVELAKVAAQLLRRHGGIFPAFPSMLFRRAQKR